MPSQAFADAEKAAADRPSTECRIYERLSCELPTTCQPASAMEMKELRWTATIADISVGGARIHLPRRFEKGTGLAIELPGTEERESTVVFVKVVHVKALGDGTWALGCKFLSELSEDQLQTMLTATHHVLSSLKKESHAEENTEGQAEDDLGDEPTAPIIELAASPEPRYLSNVQLEVETSSSVVNCVIRRLNVTKSWPLIPGKVLSLNGKAPDGTPWTLRIQVVQCSEYETGWDIRGRSIGPSSATEIVQALGGQAACLTGCIR
jgi:PilZ domain